MGRVLQGESFHTMSQQIVQSQISVFSPGGHPLSVPLWIPSGSSTQYNWVLRKWDSLQAIAFSCGKDLWIPTNKWAIQVRHAIMFTPTKTGMPRTRGELQGFSHWHVGERKTHPSASDPPSTVLYGSSWNNHNPLALALFYFPPSIIYLFNMCCGGAMLMYAGALNRLSQQSRCLTREAWRCSVPDEFWPLPPIPLFEKVLNSDVKLRGVYPI